MKITDQITSRSLCTNGTIRPYMLEWILGASHSSQHEMFKLTMAAWIYQQYNDRKSDDIPHSYYIKKRNVQLQEHV